MKVPSLIILSCTSYTLGFVSQQGLSRQGPGGFITHSNAKGAATRVSSKGTAGTTSSALQGGGSSFFHESQRNDVYASDMHRDEMRMEGQQYYRGGRSNSNNMSASRSPPFRNPFTPYRRTPYDEDNPDSGSYSGRDSNYFDPTNEEEEFFYGNSWEHQRQDAFVNSKGHGMSGQAMEERMFSQQSNPYEPSASSFVDPRQRRNVSYGMKSPGYPRGSSAYSPQPPRPSWNRPPDNTRRNGFEPLQAHPQRMSAPPPPMNQAYNVQSPRMQQSDYYYPQQTMDPSFFDAMDRRNMFRPQRQPPRPTFQQERFNNFEVPSWFPEAAASSSYWREDEDGRFSPRRGMNRPQPPFYPPPMDARGGGGGPRWNPRSQQQPGNQFPWDEQDMFSWDPWRDGFPGQTFPGQAQNWGTYGNNNDDEYDFISPGENGFGPRSVARSPSVDRKQRQKPRTKGPMGPSFTEEDDKNIVVDVLPNHPPDAVFSYTVSQADKARRKSPSTRGGGTRNDGFRGPDPVGSEPKNEERQQNTSSASARGTAPWRKKSTRSQVDPFGPSFTDSSVSREVVMGPKSKDRTSASKVKTSEERANEPNIGAEFGKLSENVFIAGPSQSNGSAAAAAGTSQQSPQSSVVQPRGVVATTPDVGITDESDHRVFIVGGIPLSNGKTRQTPPQNDVIDKKTMIAPNPILEKPGDVEQSVSDVLGSAPYEAHASSQLSAYEQQLQAFYDAHSPPTSPMPEYPLTNLVDNTDVVVDKSDDEQRMQSFYSGGPPRK